MKTLSKMIAISTTVWLAVLFGGCYTQLSSAGQYHQVPSSRGYSPAPGEPAWAGDEVYGTDEYGSDAYDGSDEYVAGQEPGEGYSGGLSDDYVQRDYDSGNGTHYGYTHTDEYETADGTVVNNYYFDHNPWLYRSWAYSHWYDPYYYGLWGRTGVWYDPWIWDPWGPGFSFSIGFGWNDPWWDFDVWYGRPFYGWHTGWWDWHPYGYGYYDYYPWAWGGYYGRYYDYGYYQGWRHDHFDDVVRGDRRGDRLGGFTTGVVRAVPGGATADKPGSDTPLVPASVERAGRRTSSGGTAASTPERYQPGTSSDTYTRRTASPAVGKSGASTESGTVQRRSGAAAAPKETSGNDESIQRRTTTTRRAAPARTEQQTERSTPSADSQKKASVPGTRSGASDESKSEGATVRRSAPTQETPKRSTPAVRSTPKQSSGGSSVGTGSSGGTRSSGGSSIGSGSSRSSSGSGSGSSRSSSGSSGRRR